MSPLNNLGRLKAVLVDMDGVIVDGMPFHLRAWKEAFASMGIEVSQTDVYLREGMDPRETIQQILREKGLSLDTQEIERINTIKNQVLNAIFQVRFIHGSLEFLSKLKAKGLKLALVTGTRKEVVERILKEGLGSASGGFDVVITAESTERKKPHPAPFLKAVVHLRRIGIDKEDCIAIENSPAGIASAKGAGLKCVALTTSLPEEYLKGADAIFHNLEEVSRLFDTAVME